jgi:ATP-binding cassette subfamily A (ABC1) protein 3
LPRYWKATPKRLAEEESLLINDEGNDYELREGIEQLSSNQPVGIQMRKLNKIYPGKQDEKVVAVNNLSMDIGTNQIMALLGHNGAGKSTTISILTGMSTIAILGSANPNLGMTSATSGEVLINGLDINENIDNLRKVMGYCPQKDLLFDELTGEQHLRIFAKLRGVDDDVLDHVVIRALENVDLIEKKDTIVKEYSGGMKRRLSLAIATIGPVKGKPDYFSDTCHSHAIILVVFLDEPTSGLDPTSRAHLWDTLKKFKEGKTIILTTHFMVRNFVVLDFINFFSVIGRS